METSADTLGKRVAYRRRLLGFSQKELGLKVGVSQQAIEKIENDATKRPRNFVELADVLGLEPYELLNGASQDRMQASVNSTKHNQSTAAVTEASDTSTHYQALSQPFSTGRDLPVRGRAQGGPDGNLIINEEPIDWTFRPPALSGVNDAFAVYVTGDSMTPKYDDGDMVYVHPNRPIKKGRYVVIETNDEHGLIKQYKGWEGDTLVVTQYNPAKEIRLDKENVKRIMLVIGSIDG